jgi:hypothetical protein
MNWLKDIIDKITQAGKPRKSFDEIYNDPGAFEYTDTGFTFSCEHFTKTLAWSDITQINVYKVDMMTTDRIDMEIVYGEKAFTISEEFPGWYRFVGKLKELFPAIPKDWDFTIAQTPFATNYRTIYNKHNP